MNGVTAQKFVDVVHQILEKERIVPLDLSQLTFLCTASSSDIHFGCVEVDELTSLLELLEHTINKGETTSLLESALHIFADAPSPSQASSALDKWFQNGPGRDKLQDLTMGLEAASVVVSIITTPNIDRRVINEEIVGSCINLMKLSLLKHIVPSLNNTGHLMATASTTGSPQPRKRRRSNESSIPSKDLKKIYKYISTTISLQISLMERLESLVQNLALEDSHLLILCSGALQALVIDCNACQSDTLPPAQQLQILGISILKMAFGRYAVHRDTILEDILHVFPELPTGKRSLRAFPVSYNSANHPSALLDMNAKLVGNLLSNGTPPHFVQMVSILIVQLLQSCVVRPSYPDDQEDAAALRSGLRTSQAVADTFVLHLLKRCIKTKGGGTSEYRPFLSNLVEDFLLLLMIPEYPAAHMLLSTVQRLLNQELTRMSPLFGAKKSSQQFDIPFLNTIFDTMGKICSVQARVLDAARRQPMHIQADVPMSDVSDQPVNCTCGSQSDEEFLIQCDQCHRIQHGSCVGIPNQEILPEEWICDECRLGKIQTQNRSKFSGLDAIVGQKSYTFHHSFQAAISHRLGVDMGNSVRFHLARWMDELNQLVNDGKKAPSPRKIVSVLLEYWDKPGPAGAPLTEDGSNRVILNLLAGTLSSFRKQMGFLIKIMADEGSPALRKLTLKVIEKTVEGDSSLMLIPVLTKAVSKRLSDDSISVREAAVSLIGSYTAKAPNAIKNYHSALLPVLNDPGVSVRKRAVKIFQSILLSDPRYQGRSSVCNALLLRSMDSKEEDGVRDLVDDLFNSLWLTGGDQIIHSGKRSRSHDDSPPASLSLPGVVTPTTPPKISLKKKQPQKRADLAAEQMMEVVRAAGGKSEHLEALLTKLLHSTIDSDNVRKDAERKKRQKVGLEHCVRLVDALFELLMVIEEQRSIRPRVGRDIAATLATIGVFASTSPLQVLKHIDTVIPYLKADNGVSKEDESAIVKATSDILSRLAPMLDRQALFQLSKTSVGNDLKKIAYTFGPSVLLSSIAAFSALAHHSESEDVPHFTQKLLAVTRAFFGFLLKKIDTKNYATMSQKTKNSILRALSVLGLVCENHPITIDVSDWGDEFETHELPEVSENELTFENSTQACYVVFSRYLREGDTAIKVKSLSALKGIFISQPSLLLQLDHVGLFTNVMADGAGVPVQLEALDCWRNILTSEEKRVDSGQAAAKMDADGKITVSKRISGDQRGEATLFGGVLTSHSPRLFEMIHSVNAKIRESTLSLLEVLLRQGLVNPNETIPHLLALQGDVNQPSIRQLALHLLMAEGEKRPDTLRQRIAAGVREAYNFQCSVYSKNDSVAAVVSVPRGKIVEIRCIFADVFEQCLAKSRKQRVGLVAGLLGLFENFSLPLDDAASSRRSSTGGKKKTRSTIDLPLLSFAAQILAHLPYSSANDPLSIIHRISSLITLQGLQIIEKMSAFLRPYGLSSDDELDDANADEDALEVAAKSKFPSRSHEALPLSSPDFDWSQFQDFCREGSALILLLRTKSFLKTSYNLSMVRCLEFDPSSYAKKDKGVPIAKPTFSQPFDASFPAAMQHSKKVDKDALIRIYAEFRRLMRDADDSEEVAEESKIPASLPVKTVDDDSAESV